MHRRNFAKTSATVTPASTLPFVPNGRSASSLARGIDVVFFGAFRIFDPRPVGALVTRLFPGQGSALLAAWRSRQFEYTWLRAAGRRYRDFWDTTGQALDGAAREVGLALASTQREVLLESYLHLTAWPDVPESLDTLRRAGLRTGLLSNLTPDMLNTNVSAAGLRGRFDYLLSTDQARTFKPAPEAYALGLIATGLPRERIAFAAFAGWDAVGAKWFGYPTVWVNRLQAPTDGFDVQPDATGQDLRVVLEFVSTHRGMGHTVAGRVHASSARRSLAPNHGKPEPRDTEDETG